MPSFTWRISGPNLVKSIKTAKFEQKFESPVFTLCNFRWYIELYPNGYVGDDNRGHVVMFCNLASLPPKLKSLDVKYSYIFEQQMISHHGQTAVSEKKKYISSWPRGTVTFKTLQKFDAFAFTINLDVVGVFDREGNDLSHQLAESAHSKQLSLSGGGSMNIFSEPMADSKLEAKLESKLDSILAQMEKLSARMDRLQDAVRGIERRMDDEEKSNAQKWNAVQQSIGKMEEKLNADPEQQRLKEWLENEVKLPDLYPIFIKNGIDNLSTAAGVDKQTLKDLGVKVGHQIKYLRAAQLLDESDTNEVVASKSSHKQIEEGAIDGGTLFH